MDPALAPDQFRILLHQCYSFAIIPTKFGRYTPEGDPKPRDYWRHDPDPMDPKVCFHAERFSARTFDLIQTKLTESVEGRMGNMACAPRLHH